MKWFCILQCIYSVGRRFVNEVLLNGNKALILLCAAILKFHPFVFSAAEKCPNVRLNFNHKLVSADVEHGTMTFQK